MKAEAAGTRSGSAPLQGGAGVAPGTAPRASGLWRHAGVLFVVAVLLGAACYAGLAVYVATRLVYAPPQPITSTPANLGLTYRSVAFHSRDDHLLLRGWFIPGIVAGGSLTDRRVIIMVHGARTNRADPGTGILELSAALARHGFAVLAFDMRGMGESAPAPLSMGYFEQRDVLGAVDFMRAGPLPYPRLGRPRAIGGWGVSMGASTLLMAAAREPSIKAVVVDSAYADVAPLMTRELPRYGVPGPLTPGILLAVRALYGIDFHAIRPLATVGRIAPRPLLLIHGTADTLIPPSDALALARAARAAGSPVQLWLVPGATHGQSFHVAGDAYVRRVTAFFSAALGPDARS